MLGAHEEARPRPGFFCHWRMCRVDAVGPDRSELAGCARDHHVEQALVHADRDLGHLRQNELALDAKALVSASKGLIDTNFKLAVDVTTAILAAAGAGKLTPVDVSAAHNGATIATLLNDLRCGRCALPNE